MPARRTRKRQVKQEPKSDVQVLSEEPNTANLETLFAQDPGTSGQRRSSRKRGFPKDWSDDDGLCDKDFEKLLTTFTPQVNSEPTHTPTEPVKTKQNNDDEVYDDGHSYGRGKYKISKARAAVPKKGVQRKPAVKKVAEKQPDAEALESEVDGNSSEEDGETMNIADIQKYLKHIKTPRSTENEKYKDCFEVLGRRKRTGHLSEYRLCVVAERIPRRTPGFQKVYETIPKLRNASPPRFTTKGIPKKRLNPEELGVRVVGKTVGNPFSSYGKKRNGVIYGNQALKTVEEMERYADAAIKVKKVLRKQAEELRLSSYVQPKVLEEARKKFVVRKNKAKEEDVDIDIETVDDSEVTFKPAGGRKRTSCNKGRKPGKTILECEDCGYKTTHSGHMKIHIVCVHKDIKTLQCQYEGCGYKCARKGSMTRHEKCVHRKDEVFKCELCDFVSAWSISLERHIVTKHEKLKPWTCQVCKKSFGQQFTLTTHMNTIHKKVKRIRCAFCNFRSATKVSVRAHILRMHKEEIEKAMDDAENNEREPDENAAEEVDASA